LLAYPACATNVPAVAGVCVAANILLLLASLLLSAQVFLYARTYAWIKRALSECGILHYFLKLSGTYSGWGGMSG